MIYLESYDDHTNTDLIVNVRTTSTTNSEPGITSINFFDETSKKLKLISTERELSRLESKLDFLKQKGYNFIYKSYNHDSITFRDFTIDTKVPLGKRNAITITPFEDEWFHVDMFIAHSRLAIDHTDRQYLIDQEYNLIKFLKQIPNLS